MIVRHPTRSLLCSCRCPLLTLSDPLLSAQPCRLLSSTSKPRGSCLSSDLWVRENLALSSQSEWPPPPRAGSTGHLLSRGSLVGAPTRRFPQRLRGTRGEDSIEAAPPFLTPPGGSVPLSSVPPVCCFAFFFFFFFPFVFLFLTPPGNPLVNTIVNHNAWLTPILRLPAEHMRLL